MNRPETGVMQFGNDWPGIFIRGDHASYYAHCIDNIHDPISKFALLSLGTLLKSSNVNQFPIPQKAALVDDNSEII